MPSIYFEIDKSTNQESHRVESKTTTTIGDMIMNCSKQYQILHAFLIDLTPRHLRLGLSRFLIKAQIKDLH